MTRRGSCVKLNADYTLARSRPVCPRRCPLLPAAISFTPFSPFARCTFPHQRLNRAVPVHEPRGEDVFYAIGAYYRISSCPSPRLLVTTIAPGLARSLASSRATYSADTCPGKIPEGTGLSTYGNHLPPGRAGQKSANRHQSRRIRENSSR